MLDPAKYVNLEVAYYGHRLCMVRAFPWVYAMGNEMERDFREMRAADHPNLNPFLGLCWHGPQTLLLWKWCERGSIADVIALHRQRVDIHVMLNLMNDIVEVRLLRRYLVLAVIVCKRCRVCTTSTTPTSNSSAS